MFYYQTTSIIVYIVFLLLSLLAVGMRLSARRMTNLPFGGDDWLILAALIINFANTIYTIVAMYTVDYEDLVTKMNQHSYRKVLYVDAILVLAVVGIIKCSVVLFYKRIFKTTKFARVANVVLGLCIAWTIAGVLTAIFHSNPVSSYWDNPGSSDLNFGLLELIMNVFDIVLDLVILSLPIPMIRKLQISPRKRLAVGAIFGLGIFCVVATSVRLAYFVQLLHIADNLPFIMKNPVLASEVNDASLLWAHIECSASIITACLPTLVPIFAKIKTITTSMGSWTRLTRKTSRTTDSDGSSDRETLKNTSKYNEKSTIRRESEAENSQDQRIRATTVVSVV